MRKVANVAIKATIYFFLMHHGNYPAFTSFMILGEWIVKHSRVFYFLLEFYCICI